MISYIRISTTIFIAAGLVVGCGSADRTPTNTSGASTAEDGAPGNQTPAGGKEPVQLGGGDAPAKDTGKSDDGNSAAPSFDFPEPKWPDMPDLGSKDDGKGDDSKPSFPDMPDLGNPSQPDNPSQNNNNPLNNNNNPQNNNNNPQNNNNGLPNMPNFGNTPMGNGFNSPPPGLNGNNPGNYGLGTFGPGGGCGMLCGG